MLKKLIEAAGVIGLLSIILLVACGSGCSRSEPPQAPQSSSSAVQPQQSQPPAVPAQPVAPPPMVAQPPAAGPQNFSQLQLGMTSDQVRLLLGEPTRIEQKPNKVEWKYFTPQGNLEVAMINDKVVSMERH